MAGERRKDYMVNSRVHVFYVVTLVASLALVGCLVALAYTLRSAGQTLPDASQSWFVAVGVLAFVIVCCSLLLGVYTIVHSHRIEGSAYRIGMVLREINAGQKTRIHLRDGDFFVDIADEINRLADRAEATGAAAPAPGSGAADATPSAASAPPAAKENAPATGPDQEAPA
ncbi:MAG: hypothetical protein D6731_12155 [Planctomycetota bacterium]|nr:MAG: hypothetical protein D6731_12155 [Planctomycetota bacterium]